MLPSHSKIERNSIVLLILIIVLISVGGIIEIVPLFRIETTIEKVKGLRPYTPLELSGYNVYIKEGCYGCHSQQIRALRDEVERYGHYSLAAESMYDYPFLWGSKRTGPDLSRIGNKYSNTWHVQHLMRPQDVVPESIMPSYPHLKNKAVDLKEIAEHMKVLKMIGVDYTDEMIENSYIDGMAQAQGESDNHESLERRYGKVAKADFDGQKDFTSELDALIAYLQVLGTTAKLQDYSSEIMLEGE